MSVKIRFKRVGAKNAPRYRIVVADSRSARNGKVIEEIGSYNPISKELKVDGDAVKSWIGKGAQPSDTVGGILKAKGIL